MMWNFDRFEDRIALQDDQGQTLTYHDLAQEAKDLFVHTQGRCLVFSLCENTMGSAVGYLSFIEMGVVPAMLGADIHPDMLRSLYENYQPAYFWAPVSFSYEACEAVYERFGYHLLKTPFGNVATLHEDLALLLTTSGSTGSPKFVRQSYQNIESNLKSIVSYLKLTKKERPITTLPMNYTYGVSIIQSHIDVGATILLSNQPITRREFWTFFKEQQATSFGGVPYTYEMLDRMRFMRMDMPSLTTMTQAGGKLMPSLHEKIATWCKETGRSFVVMYGQCEATARMAYLPWERSLDKVGAMGIAIPGGRFELIDVNGAPITQTGVTGELRYYGDNVTMGYAETMQDLAKGDERNGVLDTGDMAQVDADGYYTIVGRKKRFLKLFGNRVNLDEVERMIKEAYPAVDCACAGKDDHLILFATDESILPGMRAMLIEKTGLSAAGFHTQYVAQVPKNESGKTLYRALEKYNDAF